MSEAEVAPEPEPEGPPVDKHVRQLWGWARGYIKRFGWSLAPMWLAAADLPAGSPGAGTTGCCCPEGEACVRWGKHLVSGLGVAREEEDVERTWSATDVRVKSGWIGIAVLTGSASELLVLDVGSGFELTRARFGVVGHVLTQETPSGGEHWFFGLDAGEAVSGDRSKIELVSGVLVLGDDGFCALAPRRGYRIVGGPSAIAKGLTKPPDALQVALAREKLLTRKGDINRDDMWRTRPGQPLVGGDPRNYSRMGDLRRLVDEHGDKMTYTPGVGWKVWTESGWGDSERSETMLKSLTLRLGEVHRREAAELKDRGATDLAGQALKWSKRSEQRATSAIISDLPGDDRILVPSIKHWDSEGWICGLPVKAGVGRLVNLRTGEVEHDARTRRVSRSLGAEYEDGSSGDLKRLWDLGCEGGPGRWFVKYLNDLEAQMGTDRIRLLQRAAGASLFGRSGVDGDTDAVFVLKGPPRSGKSTFSECLLKVAGGYGKAQNHNLLFGDKGNPEFSDAAVLGYRVMTLSEPPMNAPLNTTKLKQLSGGDSITGRLPYGREEVSFTPECTLWLSTNHALEVADEAVWRRMKFFPFEHTWEGGAEKPALRAALTSDPAELRLALAWMLQGARDWVVDGWGDTAAWDESRGEEKAKHDPIARWVMETLAVTKVAADTFTASDAMSSFDFWMVASGSDKIRLTRAALRDEMEYAMIRAGLVWDVRKKLFVGGVLR